MINAPEPDPKLNLLDFEKFILHIKMINIKISPYQNKKTLSPFYHKKYF